MKVLDPEFVKLLEQQDISTLVQVQGLIARFISEKLKGKLPQETIVRLKDGRVEEKKTIHEHSSTKED